jgi:protein phosphatase
LGDLEKVSGLQKCLVTWRGYTDVGRVRQTNQDSFLVDEDRDLFIVADGMGGHAGGEIASKLCVEQISSYLKAHRSEIASPRDHPNGLVAHIFMNAVNFASTKIYERALEDPSLKGMGTTATVAQLIGRFLYIAHVGDSRCYLVRCQLIYQITSDHSLVHEQVKAGLITQEESEFHHLRNVITRSVGYQEEEDVDTQSLPIEDGDFIVMCSDGLHGKITDKEISIAVSTSGIEAAAELIKLANERGGEDNITLLIFHVKFPNQSVK